jgi:hypothetical protein
VFVKTSQRNCRSPFPVPETQQHFIRAHNETLSIGAVGVNHYTSFRQKNKGRLAQLMSNRHVIYQYATQKHKQTDGD